MTTNTKNRQALEALFVEDTILDEGNFSDLIDAITNRSDDGLERSVDGPLEVEAATVGTKQALALYKDLSNPPASWAVELAPTPSAGWNLVDGTGHTRLFIGEQNGHVGLGTTSPDNLLTVQGGLRAPSLDVAGQVSFDATHGLRFGQQAPCQYKVIHGSGTHSAVTTGFAVADWIVLVAGFDTSAGAATHPGGVKLWPYVGGQQNDTWYLGCELEGGPQITWHATLLVLRRSFVHVPTSGGLPLSPPAAPTGVSVAPGDQKVWVHFTPPTAPVGVTLTGYTTTFADGRLAGNTEDPAATSIEVDGLTNGTPYRLSVTAHSSAGSSQPSNTACGTPRDPVTRPGPPKNVRAQAGDGQAVVHFDPPDDLGGAHQLQYQAVVHGDSNKAATGQSPITVQGLQNGHNYQFIVRAHNSAGYGDYSSPPSEAVTPMPPLHKPGQPTITRVQPYYYSEYGVWGAWVYFNPPLDTGGATSAFPLSYGAAHYPPGSRPPWPERWKGESPIWIPNLQHGQSYYFVVLAAFSISGDYWGDNSPPCGPIPIE